MALNPDISTLLGFACEAVLYGIYITLFFLTLNNLVWSRRSPYVDALLLSATCSLFVLCTTHFAIQFNHFYTHLKSVEVEGVSSETIPLAVGDFILCVADLIGNFVLLHRCWVVWERNYFIVLFPALASLGGFVCGIVTFHMILTIGLNRLQPSAPLVKIGTAVFVLPLFTNISVTVLIVGRILSMASSTHGRCPKNIRSARATRCHSSADGLVWHAASIIVESGLIYLVAQLVLVVLYSLENPAYKVLGYLIIQIYGIAPTLIICRVTMGVSHEQTRYGTDIGPSLPSFEAMAGHTNSHSSGAISLDYRTAIFPTPPCLNKSSDFSKDFEMTSFRTDKHDF